ncbi:DUF4062 domain-containing protein [Stenotrophomonas sp. SORGH_AS_0321]|uniref:DUF4062 domain-containing protein n=1 Tax=Stenotrophomonas sp. SORGH_AS_0321 TaxID=3041787 RepID=UPI0028619CB8|nr:DUF4062 domain-containing protein [Stenotrophomonas sp. SORGH_AS_0321]MDR6094032.1 rubrerythrin [Stenotrophomonas sp. SORGH_AS_0321]
MARPRVFVSSTYYDLKHLRSSLENFIESMGYEPVLAEKDNIAYAPDSPLDESCSREARNSDIYVLIIGGRYGSEVSASRNDEGRQKEFFDRYESVTKYEYLNAVERNIPIYILIESSVDAEYQTYLKNKDSEGIKYAHVDSINVFVLIEEIRQRKQNNPIKLFSRYAEIENWLREQWAGLFQEFIHRLSTTQQIHDLSTKIEELGQTTETLKRYLEQIVESVSAKKPDALEMIKQENARLIEAKRDAELLSFGYVKHINNIHNVDLEAIRSSLRRSQNYSQFVESLFPNRRPMCLGSSRAFSEINEARLFLDLPMFEDAELDIVREQIDAAKRLIKNTAEPKLARKPPAKRQSVASSVPSRKSVKPKAH